MGMFDDIRCKYPLPLPEYQDNTFQTKDTPNQFMDLYEIREDGTLWHENYDVEDHSNLAKWKAAHPGEEPPEGMDASLNDALFGCMTRINTRWEQVPFKGEIQFYNVIGKCGWVCFSAYFVDGKLNQLHLIQHTKPT